MPNSLLYVSEGFPYALFDPADPDLPYKGPLRVDGWCFWMKNHPDLTFAKTLAAIIRKGAKTGYQGQILYHNHPNHQSARAAPDILTADLQKQLQHDRLTQVDPQTEPRYVCSPLGLVPKHDGGWRRIHDLSFPRGDSVNDGIPQEWGALEYTTYDDAVNALLQQGPGAIFVKRDLKDAFRHIPVAISDQYLLGFHCDGLYWIERYLPFGLRTSPFIFDLFAKAINWIMIAVLLWAIVLHYLDDFFAILAPGDDAVLYSQHFDHVCSDLGVTINHTKDVMGTIADFLGIEFNSILMQARLPPDKLARARNTAKNLLKRATISHQALESAVGFLSFAAKIVIPGRAFLRRLFDALRRPGATIRITSHMKADLQWWDTFLKDWNGLQLLRHVASRPTWYIWTDASGKFGMGGYILEHPDLLQSAQDVFSTRVATRDRRKDIQFKEMKAIQHAIQLWLDRLSGSRLVLYCDNDACVQGLTKSSIRGLAMTPLRHIVMLAAKYDILLVPTWIPTKANQLADDLSRFRYRKIADTFPQLKHLATSHPAWGETHLIPGTTRPHCLERQHVSSGGDLPQKREKHMRPPSNPTATTAHQRPFDLPSQLQSTH